jgi:hypothetical protein
VSEMRRAAGDALRWLLWAYLSGDGEHVRLIR